MEINRIIADRTSEPALGQRTNRIDADIKRHCANIKALERSSEATNTAHKYAYPDNSNI